MSRNLALHLDVSLYINCELSAVRLYSTAHKIDIISGSGVVLIGFRSIENCHYFHYVMRYLRMFYIVWGLVTLRFTRLKTMCNILKYCTQKKVKNLVRLRFGLFFSIYLSSVLYNIIVFRPPNCFYRYIILV